MPYSSQLDIRVTDTSLRDGSHAKRHQFTADDVRSIVAAIDEANNRNRKPVTLARAIERLMLLDAVLAQPELRWLGTEREKVEYFRRRTRLSEDEMLKRVMESSHG